MFTLFFLLIRRMIYSFFIRPTPLEKGDNMDPKDCCLEMESEDGVEPYFTGEKLRN